MLQSSQSIIFLLSGTTVHFFIGAYHFEEGRTTYYFSTKDMEIFNALSYQSIAGKWICRLKSLVFMKQSGLQVLYINKLFYNTIIFSPCSHNLTGGE